MWNTILFDLDGTLTDSQEGIINSIICALEHFGIQEERANLLEFVGPPLDESFRLRYQFSEEQIAVGIDTQNGRVKTAGWVEDSGLDFLAFAKQMEAMDVKTIIFTDIDTDGALSGPSFGRLEALQKEVSCQIVASGGVSCNEDLVRLHEMGLYGAIVGKAYYTGQVNLAEAVKQC